MNSSTEKKTIPKTAVIRCMANHASLGWLASGSRYCQDCKCQCTCGLKSTSTNQPMTISRSTLRASTTSLPRGWGWGHEIRCPSSPSSSRCCGDTCCGHPGQRCRCPLRHRIALSLTQRSPSPPPSCLSEHRGDVPGTLQVLPGEADDTYPGMPHLERVLPVMV